MTDATYNGWTNYETWAVSMFLDGNYTGEGTYRYVAESVQEWLADGRERWSIADGLEETVRESMDYEERTLMCDLLGASLARVDWYELADAWIENARGQVES